jgi:hypothetical protein
MSGRDIDDAAPFFYAQTPPLDQPATIEPSVIELLNSKTILSWAEVTLGL